ncbi:MAG: hypothetical protein JWL84_1622 [Rhodospirillales bacterium]|nr:hypothetical protein [Rhodospirillales bacterium]
MRPIDRLQGIKAAAHVREIKPHQSGRRKVLVDDRLGHEAPSAASEQQGVLGAKIGESPRLNAEHADVLTL